MRKLRCLLGTLLRLIGWLPGSRAVRPVRRRISHALLQLPVYRNLDGTRPVPLMDEGVCARHRTGCGKTLVGNHLEQSLTRLADSSRLIPLRCRTLPFFAPAVPVAIVA